MKILLTFCLLLYANIIYADELILYGLDNSKFPLISSNFHIFDSLGNKIIPTKNEIGVKENGLDRIVTDVSCFSANEPLSILFLVDVTTFNNLNTSKSALKKFLNVIDLTKDEVSIVSYDDKNYVNLDFSTDINLIDKTINELNTLSSNEDHLGALNNPNTGAINFASKGKYKPIVVMLSSCSHFPGNSIQNTIDYAKSKNVSLNFIVFDIFDWTQYACQTIALNTGGYAINKIPEGNEDLALIAFKKIYNVAIEKNPCKIEWYSENICKLENYKVEATYKNLIFNTSYNPPTQNLSNLELSTYFMPFGAIKPGTEKDIVLKIKAINSKFVINNIKSKNGSRFSILNTQYPIVINKDETKNITVRFSPLDSLIYYSSFEIETDLCPVNFSATGGFYGKKLAEQTIKLIFPNGNEELVVGSDTNVVWDGISDNDEVQLDYSIDAGVSWKNLAKNAKNLKYLWSNIPKPVSNKCLVKLIQLSSKSASFVDTLSTLIGHTGEVVANDWDRDGNRVVTVSWDGTIKIWGAVSGNLINSVNIGTYISSVDWSSDDRFIVTGGWDKTVKVWEASTLNLVHSFSDISGGVTSVKFSNNNQMIASGSKDNVISIWDLPNRKLIKTLPSTISEILALDWHPNNNYLASSSFNIIQIWDVSIGSEVKSLLGHSTWVLDLKWNKNGNYLLSSSDDRSIKVWDFNAGKINLTLYGHNGSVNSIDWSPDETRIISVSDDQTLKFWDFANKSELMSFNGHTNNVKSVNFNKKGNLIVTSSSDKTSKVWYVDSNILQTDTSNNVFSIVEPVAIAKDVFMGKCFYGESKDSVIVDFIENISKWNLRVDSIFFTGIDANAFSIVAGLPKYTIDAKKTNFAELQFNPIKTGMHNAICTIITQNDTLKINITGIGVIKSINLITNLIDFGKVELLKSKDSLKIPILVNVSDNDIIIKATKHTLPNINDFSTYNPSLDYILGSKDTLFLDMAFSPSNIGIISSRLEILHLDYGSPEIVQLFGEGYITEPQILTTSEPFNIVNCQIADTTAITIKNIGTKELIIKDVIINGIDKNEFKILNLVDITTKKLKLNEETKLFLEFLPINSGTKFATLEIISNSLKDSVIIIPLQGTKEFYNVEFKPNKIDLGFLCNNELKSFTFKIFNNTSAITTFKLLNNLNFIFEKEYYSIPALDSIIVIGEYISNSYNSILDTNITIIDTLCNQTNNINIKAIIESPILNIDDIIIKSYKGKQKNGELQIENKSIREITVTEINGVDLPFYFDFSILPITIDGLKTEIIPITYYPDRVGDTLINVEIKTDPCETKNRLSLLGNAYITSLDIGVNIYQAYTNEIIEIPLILNSIKNTDSSEINNFSIDLSFNPSLLYPLDFPLTIIDDKTANITVTNIQMINKIDEVLAKVRFKVGLGNAEDCDLILSNPIINGGNADITFQNGKFNLLGICYEGGVRLLNPNSVISMANISPNPVSTSIKIDLSLSEIGNTEVSIYNIIGEKVKTLFAKDITEKGNITINSDISELSNGQFIVIFKTPTYIEKSNILVIK